MLVVARFLGKEEAGVQFPEEALKEFIMSDQESQQTEPLKDEKGRELDPETGIPLGMTEDEYRLEIGLPPKLNLQNGEKVIFHGWDQDKPERALGGICVGLVQRGVWDIYIVMVPGRPFGDQYPFDCMAIPESQLAKVPEENKPRLVLAGAAAIKDLPPPSNKGAQNLREGHGLILPN